MKRTGGCQCGAIRFTTSNEPVVAIACHCKTCRQRTGAPYGVGVYFKEEDVEFTGIEAQTFQYSSETSNRWLRNEFCPVCATTFSWTLEMRPGTRGIAAGCFDDINCYTTDAHVWTESARDDMCYPEDIKLFRQARTVASKD